MTGSEYARSLPQDDDAFGIGDIFALGTVAAASMSGDMVHYLKILTNQMRKSVCILCGNQNNCRLGHRP